MDPPVAAEAETKSEKTEKAKTYDCGLCDTEVVYKIAQELLPGLASSCVDNTTGGIFTTAGSIAVDMRKEMADYLTQRSETYVAEFLLSENASMLELSEHPYDIIMHLIDDFASSKTNMFSRVSEWVSSDRREDRIDDFVQEMEINGFWLLARREYVASILLKNVDYKNSFHCNMVCSSDEELAKHRSECKFRPMDCTNEGCTTRYCAAQKEHHEAVCPFMILPCEQKCSDFVMRREMDRHCVTICPTKLVNCAFYTVGCSSSIPRCNVQQHNADELSSHLLYILKTAHKESSDEDLKHRVEQILSLSNKEKLARARDARALTYLIKDAEPKLGPVLDIKTKPQEGTNKKESPAKPEPSVVKDAVGSPKESPPAIETTSSSTVKPVITEEVNTKSPSKEPQPEPESSTEKPVKIEDNTKSPSKEPQPEPESSTEKPVITEDNTKSPSKEPQPEPESSTEKPAITEDNTKSPSKEPQPKPESSTEKPVITEVNTKSPTKEPHPEPEPESSTEKPVITEDNTKSPGKEPHSEPESSTEKPVITEVNTKSPTKEPQPEPESSTVVVSPDKKEESKDNDESVYSSPVEEHEHGESQFKEAFRDEQEEHTTRSLPGETVKELSFRSDEEESKKSTEKREDTHESYGSDSDYEESMKSPVEINHSR